MPKVSCHCRRTSETPLKWRFAGGPILADFYSYWDVPQELEVRSLNHTYSLKTKSSRCHYYYVMTPWAFGFYGYIGDIRTELQAPLDVLEVLHFIPKRDSGNQRMRYLEATQRRGLGGFASKKSLSKSISFKQFTKVPVKPSILIQIL